MPDALGDPVVSCTFVRLWTTGTELAQHDVKVHSGTSAWRIRLRHACCMAAIDGAAQMWAMPHLVDAAPDDWLVYENNTGAEQSPVFVKRFPNRDAAEMWMLHCGA